MVSIRTRLLLAASAVLLVFIGLCGLGLEKAFRDSAEAAQSGRLQGLVYALLGAAEAGADGRLSLGPEDLPEPRLQQPQSGLEAALLDETGAELWRSPSAGSDLPVVIGPEVGKARFERLDMPGRFVLSFGLRWIDDANVPHRYTVVVLEDTEAYEAQLSVFRRTLWTWLLGAGACLLVALLAVQRWGLAPLRRLVGELHGVEAGVKHQIGARYPHELTPLTGALNAMIRNERSQQARYRNALGDLAHSLKTPLAVLRGLPDEALPGTTRHQLEEQIGRMQDIVDHQLARAAAAGRRTLAHPVALRPLAEKLVGALAKVYAGKDLRFDLAVPEGLKARADTGDLYELLGNCLDNASKWAKQRVRLTSAHANAVLELTFEDDGPGFPEHPERLLERGMRADTRVPGQGLGLATVAEIVKAYEGTVALGRSADLGGARVVLTVPA